MLGSMLDKGKRLEYMSHDKRVKSLVINVILISSKVANIHKVKHKVPN